MNSRPKQFFEGFRNDQTGASNFIEKLRIKHPKEWKRLQKKFDIGRKNVLCQLNSGLDIENEKVLRAFYDDFVKRFLKHGPGAFPTAWNPLEPFFVLNDENMILELVHEEEAYVISLEDYLEYVTSDELDASQDSIGSIEDNLIYHVTFTEDSDNWNFGTNDTQFVVSGFSLVRQSSQVAILLQAGKSFDLDEAKAIIEASNSRDDLEYMNPRKRELGFDPEITENAHVVKYKNREDLWLHCVAVLLDLETRTIDIRWVGRDENIKYNVVTDDLSALLGGQADMALSDAESLYASMLTQIAEYDAVFDLAVNLIHCPKYIEDRDKQLVGVSYESSLNKLIPGPIAARKYKEVKSHYKAYSRQVYYLESPRSSRKLPRLKDDKFFEVNRTGYWKRLTSNEKGEDKRGNPVLGKTWVQRTDAYTRVPGITNATVENVGDRYTGKNAGYIYIVRDPSHLTDIYKVGLTRREPEVRTKELSNTSSPGGFFILQQFETADCVIAESRIHKILEPYRVSANREFFSCSLKLIIESCERIVTQVNKECA